jgi:tripartite-type tricarboxylate transporter receptor subunit TctC
MTRGSAQGLLAVFLLIFADMRLADGQEFPSKPIRIVTAGVGGGSDFAARLIGQAISGPMGQQVIVDNRSGGVIPGEVVAKSAPDGYTLLLYGSAHWLAPFLQDKVPYDPIKDFLPVTLAASTPAVLVVHPSLPVKSIKELIALAKARPGQLNYATGAAGSSDHLAAELFRVMAALDMVRIPYKSGTARMTDLVGGHVLMSFGTGGTLMPHINAGKLRALGVTSAQPSALFPNLPTIAASGLPGYEAVSIYGVFVPARTSDPVIRRLNQEIVRALNQPELKEKLLLVGVEPVGSSANGLAAAVQAEMTKLGKIIKDAGIRAD